MMRIVGGKHRSRVILSPKDKGIRPTSSKMREAMFNILSSMDILEDARVLDLCCGTGALGIEAISRGAKKVVFIDGSSDHLKLAWENICSIKEQDASVMLRASVENLPKAREKFTLAFLDPPYYKGLVNKALISLEQNEWLEKSAIIMVELPIKEDVKFSEQIFEQILCRNYGNSKLIILKYIK